MWGELLKGNVTRIFSIEFLAPSSYRMVVVLDPSFRTRADGGGRSRSASFVRVRQALEDGRKVGWRWRVKVSLICKN